MSKLKPGGSEGGVGMFCVGFVLAAIGLYLFFDSVRVTTGVGIVGRVLRGGRGGGGWMETTSTGILFIPFLLAIIALFYDATKRWAWWLLSIGLAIIAVEVLSRMRLLFEGKLTHLLLMFVLFGAGVGLILRSYKAAENPSDAGSDDKPPKDINKE